MQNKLKLSLIYILSFCFAVCVFAFTYAGVKTTAEENGEIIITVQTGYTKNNLPNGVEGFTYPIFDFVATDASGNKIDDTSVSVYYDVNSDTKLGDVADDVLVVVENNRFYTENAGTYVIEYIASKGVFSKIENIFVEVVGVEDYIAPNYVINTNVVSQAQTGSKIYLPDGQLVASEIFGKTELQIQVLYNGEYDCDQVKINTFDQRLKYFTPQVSGDYTLNYIITDILGKNEAVTVSKTITVIDSDMPVIIAPSISEVYIIDEQYKLPFVEAVQYHNGEIVYVPVSATFNGVAIGEDMTFTPTESGNFEIVFIADNVFGGEDAQLAYKVVVNQPDEEKPYIDRLMKLDGFDGFYRTKNNSEGLEKGYILEADGTNEMATMSFKNKIAVQFLHMGVTPEPTYNDYQYIDFIITDSVNSSEQIVVGIKKGADGVAQLYINGFFVKNFDNGDFNSSSTALEFKYDFENKTLLNGLDEFFADINSYADGSEFLGFSSGKVYIKLVMGGITAKSQVILDTVASYIVSNDKDERTKPKIVFENTVTSVIAYTTDINQTVKIKKYAAFDAYDENIETYLTIYSPKGKQVLSTLMEDDIDYVVKEYGTYLLQYKFVDTAGRNRSIDGIIQVIDRVAPTVVKMPTFSLSAKKGSTYNFPEVQFEDNATDKLTIYVFLYYGNSQKVLAKKTEKDGKIKFSYKFTQSGTYTVQYCAVDEAGNRTIVSYDILCK